MPRMLSIARIDTAATVSMVSRRALLLVFASEHAKPAAHVAAAASFLRRKNVLRMACSSFRVMWLSLYVPVRRLSTAECFRIFDKEVSNF